MRSWLAALRIARREARRAKGRSLLVIALIGLPVLGLSFAAVSYDMFTLTAEERLTRQLGAADAVLRWDFGGPAVQADVGGTGVYSAAEEPAPSDVTVADIEALLPAGSRAVPRWYGSIRLTTVTGRGWLSWQALDLADPITAGLIGVTDGRAPAGRDEVALTAAAVTRLGAGIGDRIEVPGEGTYTVVGEVEFPGVSFRSSDQVAPGLHDPVLLFHLDGRPVGPESGGWVTWQIESPRPVTLEQVRALNQHGILVHSRAVAQDPPPELLPEYRAGPTVEVPAFGAGALIAGLAVLEIVLLAGPAFAVGARRRQRELALVGAGGGAPAHLRRIVLADGLVLGVAGAVVGVTLGLTAALAGRPLVEEHLAGVRAGGYRVFPLALVAIVVLATGTGLLAALVPAFAAARKNIVDALAGRRGMTRSRRRWLALGLVMVALGTAVTAAGAWLVSANVVLAGLIIGQLGLVLCTPSLVGLIARLGSRLPLAPRIALRDTARNRAAAAPAISAVMAAVAGSVAAGVIVLGLADRQDSQTYSHPPGTAAVYHWWDDPENTVTPDDVARVARETLPFARAHRSWEVACDTADAGSDTEPGTCEHPVVTVAPDQVCPYWERAFDLSVDEQRAARADPRCDGNHHQPFGQVVADDGAGLPVLTGGAAGDLAAAAEVLRAGGAVVTDPRYLTRGEVTLGVAGFAGTERAGRSVTVPAYLLTSGINRDGAIVSPAVLTSFGLATQPGPVLIGTTRMPTVAEVDAFTAALEELDTFGHVTRPHDSERVDAMLVLLAIAAAAIAIGAAGIATGLAAADRRPDLATLAAVGASPRVRRRLALSQSGVIAGLGTGLGVLAGLGASTAVLVALNQRYAEIWPGPDPIPISVPWLNLAALVVIPAVAMLGAGVLTRSRLPIERRAG